MPIVLHHCAPREYPLEKVWHPIFGWPQMSGWPLSSCWALKICFLVLLALTLVWPHAAFGQTLESSQGGWSAGVQTAVPPGDGLTTTVIPNVTATPAPPSPTEAVLTLTAFLTLEADAGTRRPIDRGLVWRIFAIGEDQNSQLITAVREPIPTLQLAPGRYIVNAAYGRAYLTQILRLEGGRHHKESFVLNAGGLRVLIKVAGGHKLAAPAAHYDLYSDERDQSGERRRVMSNARPGLITRLNSGIYHIVSRLGDANALVAAEVAVEAGKLTEAIVSHEAAKVTLKLVQSVAGEAHADTESVLMTESGDVIKETAGALPTHVLAPGSYSVSARRGGRLYTRTFNLKSGDNVEIEVMMQ